MITRRDHWSVKSPTGWIRVPRDGRWNFDGDLIHPTFWPSVLEDWIDDEGKRQVNHVIIERGNLRFLEDCTHGFVGRTVPVVELSDAEFAFHFLRHQDSEVR